MAKSILGVDIGYDSLKLALVRGDRVRKTAVVPMPKNLIRQGHVTSPESMGELIRSAMKENRLRCADAAIVLPNENVFVRTVTMPRMTADQLVYNLPYEFSDYITDELKDYAFDYAMVSNDRTEGGERTMELMAVGAPLSLIEDTRELLRKAGLKLTKAAPAESSYIALIRRLNSDPGREYCILDLGYQAIRMYMFRGDRHVVTRVLEIGLSSLDEVIAESDGVDVHLAHTYLVTDHDGCQSSPACLSAYGNIAVELMRALNFYRFSNPDSHLSDIWLCGGGAVIEPLARAVADTLDLAVHSAEELMPSGCTEGYKFMQAVGAALA